MTKEEWNKLDTCVREIEGDGYAVKRPVFLLRRELDLMRPEPTTEELIEKLHKDPSPATISALSRSLNATGLRQFGPLRYEPYTATNCRTSILIIDNSAK